MRPFVNHRVVRKANREQAAEPRWRTWILQDPRVDFLHLLISIVRSIDTAGPFKTAPLTVTELGDTSQTSCLQPRIGGRGRLSHRRARARRRGGARPRAAASAGGSACGPSRDQRTRAVRGATVCADDCSARSASFVRRPQGATTRTADFDDVDPTLISDSSQAPHPNSMRQKKNAFSNCLRMSHESPASQRSLAFNILQQK